MNKFTENATEILEKLARHEAFLSSCMEILPEHIILAIINFQKCTGNSVLSCFSEELKNLKDEIYKFLQQYSSEEIENPEKIIFSRRIQTILDLALMESMAFGDDSIGTEHLLIAVIRETGSFVAKFFFMAGIELRAVRQKTSDIKNAQKKLTQHEPEYIEHSIDYLKDKYFPKTLAEEYFDDMENHFMNDISAENRTYESSENEFEDDKIDSFFDSCTRDLTVLSEKQKIVYIL